MDCVIKAKEDGGRRRWPLVASALALLVGCQGLIGIEELSAEARADSGDLDGSVGPGVMLGSGGLNGEFPDPPANDDCLAEVASECRTSITDRPGLCGPGGICTEYCILDESWIDQCLLR